MKIVDVSAATFGQISEGCLGCTYWHGKVDGDAAMARQHMFADGRLRGKIALDEDGAAMGFIQYGELDVYPAFAKLRQGFSSDMLPSPWVITCITTHKEHRGKGVSKQLVLAVLEDAAREGQAVEAVGMEEANYEVISTGPADLYRKADFQELARFRDEYGVNVFMRYGPRLR